MNLYNTYVVNTSKILGFVELMDFGGTVDVTKISVFLSISAVLELVLARSVEAMMKDLPRETRVQSNQILAKHLVTPALTFHEPRTEYSAQTLIKLVKIL